MARLVELNRYHPEPPDGSVMIVGAWRVRRESQEWVCDRPHHKRHSSCPNRFRGTRLAYYNLFNYGVPVQLLVIDHDERDLLWSRDG